MRPFTGPHVCHLFVQARKAFSGREFLVAGGRPGTVEGVPLVPAGLTDAPMAPGVLKVLHWFNRHLREGGKDENGDEVPNEKAQMREWLRVKVGAGGPSLRDTVRAHPSWGRKKAGRDPASFEARWKAFQRQHDATCDRVAGIINARAVVPWFDIDDEGRAIDENGNVITLA